MQAQIKDTMLYKGIVELSYKVGDRIISKEFHNSGTEQLKRAFAMFMCGGENARMALGYLPTKLDLKFDSPVSGWTSALHRPAPVTNPTYNYDSVGQAPNISKQWYVEYNSMIPYTLLKSGGINTSYNYRFYLLCNEINPEDTSDELAYIDVNSEDLTSLQAGVSILISWKLKLLNDSEI